jgi:hypothetical protein
MVARRAARLGPKQRQPAISFVAQAMIAVFDITTEPSSTTNRAMASRTMSSSSSRREGELVISARTGGVRSITDACSGPCLDAARFRRAAFQRELSEKASEQLAALLAQSPLGDRASKLAAVLASSRAANRNALARIDALAQSLARFSQLDHADKRLPGWRS